MARAKEQGRGRSACYGAAPSTLVRDPRPLEAALRDAIESGELELHYQPQVAFRDGRVAGAEALLRWRHPEHGVLPPDRFLSIAEALGLSAQLDAWVLREAFATARRWAGEGSSIPLSVNLSAAQLASPTFVGEIAALARETGVDASLMRLEVAATLVARDPAAAQGQMQALCAAGFPLALDHFGTGHSSLAHLERVPLTELKIEPGFVRDLPLDAGAVAVARTLIDMAHSLGVRVVAEGVEHEAQFALLRDEGCDAFQGFYCCQPLPERDFLRFVFPERGLLEVAQAAEAAIAA
jgi:EAL domain-containing protein (putative c-di-GMP-specific phosphodiesterase class I)